MAQTSTDDDGSSNDGSSGSSGGIGDRIVSFLTSKVGMAVAAAFLIGIFLAWRVM